MEIQDGNIKTGYKLVLASKNELYSWNAEHRPGYPGHSDSHRVYYKLNEWTYPNKGGGPLVCFPDFAMDYALNILKSDSFWTAHLYKCLYRPSKIRKVWYPYDSDYETLDEIQLMYSYSVFADAICLTELVAKFIAKRRK